MKHGRIRWPGITIGLMLALAAFVARSNEIPRIDTGDMETRVRVLIEETRKELENNLDAAVAWGQMGMVLHAHDLTDAALLCYVQAIQRDADDYRWLYLAAVAVWGKAPTRSAEYFAKAALLHPHDAAFFIAFADVLTRLGRYEDAHNAYEKARAIDSRSSFAHIGLARLALIRGDVADARSTLERVRDRSPRLNNVHTLLAQAYRRLGERASASRAEWLAKVHNKRLKPHSPVVSAMASLAVNAQAYQRRGAQLADRSDFAGAESAYRQVLIIRVGSSADFMNLATVLSKQGKYTEAFEFFDRGLGLSPDHVGLLSSKGRAHVDVGQFDRAAEMLAKAIDADPNFADASLNSGILRFRQGRFAEAVEHFERALTLDPSLYRVYFDLGRAYADDGKLESAVVALQRLREIEPDNELALNRLGLLQIRLGRYDAAIEMLDEAWVNNPTNTQTTILLARLLASAPDASSRDAPRALAMAMDLYRIRSHDAGLADLLAMAYAANGQFDKAIRLSERAIEIARDKPRLVEEFGTHLDSYRRNKPIYLPSEGVGQLMNLPIEARAENKNPPWP